VFFTLGLWLGLESIVKKSYTLLFFHIMSVGYAAQVRPVLSLYPLINFFILISIAVKYDLWRHLKTYKIIVISIILLLISCNLPSMRNYMNHKLLRPTDTLSNDMFSQLAKLVLIDMGKSDEYEEKRKALEEISDVTTKIYLQEEFAIRVFKDYPLMTLKEMMHNAVGILGRAHWPLMAHFWGYSFLDNFSPDHMPLKKSTAVYLIETLFNFIYLSVYFLSLGFLIRLFRSGNVVFSLTIVLFIAYFLIPTFIGRGAGSRYRLPAEGLIVMMASCEFDHRFELLKEKLFRLINGINTLVTQR
jgi:hypothetical protein